MTNVPMPNVPASQITHSLNHSYMTTSTTDLRYPIGQFDGKIPATATERQVFMDSIAAAPQQLRQALNGLTTEQIETPYRPGGWTVRQVVHHIADSHINAYCRFKLALTENTPTIKPYKEGDWALLGDTPATPIEVSLVLLEALHQRWHNLLLSMADTDFERVFNHPEGGLTSLKKSLGMYTWHGKHHIAHITSLRERMGW
jgi:hypothetical protein